MSDQILEKVLVVDDDESSRRTLSMVLSRAGYQPLEASTGEEALAKSSTDEPAMVLLDIKLPDQRGTEVLTKLRALDPDLAVVMITAHASVETAVAALNQGAAAFIVKPLNLDDVLATIRQLLEKRRLVVENKRLYEEVQHELEERRRAEAERNLLVMAVEAAGESIIVTDTDGAVEYANPAFEWSTGYGLDEVEGRSPGLLERVHNDESSSKEIEESLRRHGAWSGLLMNRRKDGDLYYEECTITPVTDEVGAVTNYVHVRRDVTEKLKLEAVAQAVNTMNNIGYVFSGIRHELGNPINSTRMTLKMLKARLDVCEKEELETYLDRVLTELSRVSFLLHSLKSFNMYESLEPRQVELRSFLDQFIVLVKGDSDKRGVSIAVDVDPVDLSVRADPRALQQVLLNVLTNALDACAKVEQPTIGLTARQARGEIIIQLEDNGVGMSEEEREDLFKPFMTTKPQGTGLGLVIAKKMIVEMEGDIDIKSQLGSGTCVRITLPEWRNEH